MYNLFYCFVSSYGRKTNCIIIRFTFSLEILLVLPDLVVYLFVGLFGPVVDFTKSGLRLVFSGSPEQLNNVKMEIVIFINWDKNDVKCISKSRDNCLPPSS